MAPTQKKIALATLGAVGIVYGDIGTSPLYALSQIFFAHGRLVLSDDNILGGISLVIWALTIIVAIKYAILVLRADNDGEGGLFALYGLLHEDAKKKGKRLLLWMLIMGAGLLLGDGIITPAISVLSAVEGLAVATPTLSHTVLPITAMLLTGLFVLQARGTSGIGKIFSPILILWFIAIAALGARQIALTPQILRAFNPIYGLTFLLHANLYGALMTLGAVMLCVTGGEAMYADLGHFGALPIRLGWFVLVYPALLLNYLGQGAYLLGKGVVRGGNLFYSMAPPALLYPMVLLATLATIIASQSLISGAFSLISQAVRLGLFPRIKIVHTHVVHSGQIYIAVINWALYLGCMALVFGFGSSARLAAAYGLSVSGVMVITSLAMFPIARDLWQWGTLQSTLVWGPLTVVNSGFLLASSLKFLEGGYVPVTIGIIVFIVMVTWKWGRKATSAAYSRKHTMSVADLIELHRESAIFVERNAILMIPRAPKRAGDHTPALLQLIWDRYGVLPRNLIFITVSHPKVPYVHHNRYNITVLEQERDRGSIISVEVNFGFMEQPNIESLLEELAQQKEIALPTDRRHWIVHATHENLLPSRTMGNIKQLAFRLFLFLRLMSQPAYYYYGLGVEMQLSTEIMPARVR